MGKKNDSHHRLSHRELAANMSVCLTLQRLLFFDQCLWCRYLRSGRQSSSKALRLIPQDANAQRCERLEAGQEQLSQPKIANVKPVQVKRLGWSWFASSKPKRQKVTALAPTPRVRVATTQVGHVAWAAAVNFSARNQSSSKIWQPDEPTCTERARNCWAHG